MEIAKVIGQVVSTVKDPHLPAASLLLVEIMKITSDGKSETLNVQVAVDTLGAGTDEWVLLVRGSSARMVHSNNKSPVDLYIVGIIDDISLYHKSFYSK